MPLSRAFALALVIVLALAAIGGVIWYTGSDDPSVSLSDGASGDAEVVTKTLTPRDKTVKKSPEESPEESPQTSETVKTDNPDIAETTGSDATAPAEEQDAQKAENNNLSGDKASELSFDIIRVEKNGDTVLAGRAPADNEVRILDGTTILGRVEADQNGQWVYVLETPLEPGTHELGLEVEQEDGSKLKSADVAIVDVPEGEESALAVLVPADNQGASRVLQLPEKVGEEGIKNGELALDSVDYDDAGKTVIGGTATPGKKVAGYLNNEFVGQGTANDQGRWTVEPEQNVEEGLHQLRIDQLDEAGKVTARVEIPFSRSGKVETRPDERVVTVQPGNSLWRISRSIYGEGAHFAVIYDRNRDQIRDPDLIYPGQIFVLPKGE